MRWQGRRQSENVEDRRRSSPKTIGFGGGLIGIILILVAMYFGVDPRPLIQNMQQQQPAAQQQGADGEIDDETKEFVSVVLADTEDVWVQLFRAEGRQYQEPELVLFSERVRSACGLASSATGPFYCPGDSKVYLDASFFEEMKQRFNAPGDFAQAYVIAHEVGHHVQNLLGISDRVHKYETEHSEAEGNRMSVRLELQADFLAGVWAHHAEKNWNILEEGDLEEAINAALAIGDDRLQKQAQGYVVPEKFTHGTSAQRSRWFAQGLRTGRMSDANQLFEISYDEL